MTTLDAIKSIFLTYCTLEGKNEEQSEAFYEDYIKKFGKANLLTNAAIMAFEINIQTPAAKKLREALAELRKTGEIKE